MADTAPAVDPPVRITRGVWLPAAAAVEPVARLAALLTALPAGSVVSGRTAAQLYGMWLPAGTGIDVTVPAAAAGPALTTGPKRRDLRAHRCGLRADEVRLVSGLRVTTPARTWFDLARELALADLVAAGDSALRAGLVSAFELAGGLARRRRIRGTARARQALPLLDAASRSRPESHLRVLLVGAGLPRPAVNVAVHDDQGGWLGEPDLSYAEARIAIEYQGPDHADPRRLRKDTARHMDLRRAGWDVLYYTAEQVFRHPEVPVADVRTALARRCPRLLATGAAARAATRRLTTSTAQ